MQRQFLETLTVGDVHRMMLSVEFSGSVVMKIVVILHTRYQRIQRLQLPLCFRYL